MNLNLGYYKICVRFLISSAREKSFSRMIGLRVEGRGGDKTVGEVWTNFVHDRKVRRQ